MRLLHAFRSLLALVGAACLTACGGGGGGGGGDGAADNRWLAITPGTSVVEAYEGESVAFIVTAQSSRTIAEPLHVAIVDARGVIRPDVSIQAVDALTYRATLQTAAALSVGVHEGAFELRLCRDNPLTCANPYPGSPWRVPYRVTVHPGTNLVPLAALAGAGDWTTYQGDARHRGFVDATVDHRDFRRRWMQPLASKGVAIAGGRIYTTSGDRFGRWRLLALSEHDGSTVWQHDFGTMFNANPPAVAGGQVVLATSGHSDTAFWAFDAASGAQRNRVPMNSQWESYLQPTVHGGAVYTNIGSYGGLARFDRTTAALDWANLALPQFDLWTPAADDHTVYALIQDRLWLIDPATGAVRSTIGDPLYAWTGYSMHGAAVLGDGGRVYATGYGSNGADSFSAGHLLAFDTAGSRVAWSRAGQTRSNPVLAGSTVWTIDNTRSLQAHDAATGALQHTIPVAETPTGSGPLAPGAPLVVVGRYAFAGLDGTTYAVDLQARQVVWRYPLAGPMAVSRNGVLLIASAEQGKLVAINLR
jgi:outer membrane protein assembly factor BamB